MTDPDSDGTTWIAPLETTTTDSNWGCACGCENEEECHGDDGCDAAEKEQKET